MLDSKYGQSSYSRNMFELVVARRMAGDLERGKALYTSRRDYQNALRNGASGVLRSPVTPHRNMQRQSQCINGDCVGIEMHLSHLSIPRIEPRSLLASRSLFVLS